MKIASRRGKSSGRRAFSPPPFSLPFLFPKRWKFQAAWTRNVSSLEILLRVRGIEGKKASINLAAHRAVGIPPWPKRVQNLALYNAHASVKKSGVGGWGLATVSSP